MAKKKTVHQPTKTTSEVSKDWRFIESPVAKLVAWYAPLIQGEGETEDIQEMRSCFYLAVVTLARDSQPSNGTVVATGNSSKKLVVAELKELFYDARDNSAKNSVDLFGAYYGRDHYVDVTSHDVLPEDVFQFMINVHFAHSGHSAWNRICVECAGRLYSDIGKLMLAYRNIRA